MGLGCLGAAVLYSLSCTRTLTKEPRSEGSSEVPGRLFFGSLLVWRTGQHEAVADYFGQCLVQYQNRRLLIYFECKRGSLGRGGHGRGSIRGRQCGLSRAMNQLFDD